MNTNKKSYNIVTPFLKKTELPRSKECTGYIYLLSDPSAVSDTKYIGKTLDAKGRYDRHLCEAAAYQSKRYVYCWIRSLLDRGIEPEMTVLEVVNVSIDLLDEELCEFEKLYISDYKERGIKLCNLTDGGDGTLGHKHSEETKKKMAEKKLGTHMTEETKQKIMRQDIDLNYIKELYAANYSLYEIAQEFNCEHNTIKYHLEKAGIEIRNDKMTDRYRQKISQSLTGKIQSEETCNKRSDSLQGHPVTPETRAKLSTAHQGKTLSAEHKQKLSAAKQGDKAPTYRTDVSTDQLVSLYSEGKSLRQIGKEVGMGHHAVRGRLIKAGIISQMDQTKDTSKFVFDYARAFELYHKGYSCNKISKELKCDSKVVKKYLIEKGVVFS